MRTFILATAVAIAATPAIAEVQPQSAPMVTQARPHVMSAPGRHGGSWRGQRHGGQRRHGRWGGRVNGRWYAGVYAPGGWTAYRQPVRGWVLPTYWYTPSFYVTDYARYGLVAPHGGYSWTRYYDDAVLVDHEGRVHDSVRGVEWDRYDDDHDDRDGHDDDRGHRDNGVGGAVIGGVVGGVAGNAIAGRGDKLGGTLIGAGVGAIAGAAIDRAEDRGKQRHDDRAGHDRGASYPTPYGHSAGRPPVTFAPPAEVVQQGGYDRYGRQRTETRGHGDMRNHGETRTHHGSGPYTTVVHGPGTVTTVTVVPAVTTTTTTTEYVYAAPYRAAKRVWRAKPRSKLCKCR